MANVIAPSGQVFVCSACGKRSRDLYGDARIDNYWDESCMMNAVLCYDGGPPWRAVEAASSGSHTEDDAERVP